MDLYTKRGNPVLKKTSRRSRTAAVALAVTVGPVALVSGAGATADADRADPSRDAGKNLIVRPAAIGKAKVGMTIKQAMRTGLFKRRGTCGPLAPKGKLDRQFGTFVVRGRLIGMKVTGRNIRTAHNLGLGTTLRKLRAEYGSRLSKPRRFPSPASPSDGGWGVVLRKKQRYLGFLLGTRPEAAHPKPSHKVTYMEVTRGRAPVLYPDGC